VQPADTVHGLVLTGGRSRRMGLDKALLQRDGDTQLARAVQVLQGELDKVFVSVREDQAGESQRARFPQIVDRYDGMGPVAGILSALEFDRNAAWLVVACDLPNLDTATVRYLLDHRSGSNPVTAFRSSSDGMPEPLCAVYEPASLTAIKAFVDEGLHCPRKMLIRSDTHLLEQPNPHALDNVNTPEDLQRAAGRMVS
jgi:molybdopterin-guanine dinucleotide biosynthesis protein A